jgi:cytochrome c-type biogenesis protein CcmH/NrfG
MIVVLIGAILTAIVTALLLQPLKGQKRAALILAGIIPMTVLGLYLWLGHPDLPSASAAFEKTGMRAERRALVAQELTLMQALSEKPDSIRLMLALSDVQMKQGHIDESIRILEHAQEQDKKNHDVKLQLGAAYYAQGVKLLLDENKAEARPWLEKAVKTAPKDAPYLGQLKKELKVK